MSAVRAGYKQTEVGVIPEDWEVCSTGELFYIQLGKMIDAARNAGELAPYLGNRHVQWSRIDLFNLPLVPLLRHEKTRYRLQEGDVLVCEGGEVGRAAIWQGQLAECYYQKALHRLRLKRANYDPRIFINLLQNYAGNNRFADYVTQTSIAHLPKEQFAKLPIPVPSSVEQSAIAEALEDADGLIEALEALIAKKRAIKQGAMQDLLTGHRRLPGFEGEWGATTLAEISEFITKGTTPTTYGFSWQSSGVLFLRSECVSDMGLDLSQSMFISDEAHKVTGRSAIKNGDLLITITGNVGRVVRYFGPEPANMNQHIARIRITSPDMDAGFVFHHLNLPAVRQYFGQITTGQAYPQLSLVQVRSTSVPCPTVDEQRAIAAVLSDMDEEIAALEGKLAKARAVKQGMMQVLLTGEIRLT